MHNDIPDINHLLDDLDSPVAPGDKKQDSKLNSITWVVEAWRQLYNYMNPAKYPKYRIIFDI